MNELNLNFQSPNSVTVNYEGDSTDLTFTNPLSQKDRDKIRRYLEDYPVQYTTDIDDTVAGELEARLPEMGQQLFDAVFQGRKPSRLFSDFQDQEEPGRLLTISASHPEILSLPWELLRDPEGAYLCNENPRISIRRRLNLAGGGRRKQKITAKDTLHLLFVVSRPKGAGFINPRTDPQAVMDALDTHAPGRVTTEFLRPATLTGLVERLENTDLPPVDILHFDGHGAYDPDGRLVEEGEKAAAALTAVFASADIKVRKDDSSTPGNMGYLLFEADDGKRDLVSADLLGEMLNRQKIRLVVLSACQSAKMGGEDAMGSVSARLTHAGIPAVIAMTHSVMVTTTGLLFGEFYKHLAKGRAIGESLDNARRLLQMKPERGQRRRGRAMIPLTLQDWFLPALYQVGKDVPLLKKPEQATMAQTTAGLDAGEGGGKLPTAPESGFYGRTSELWQIERAFLAQTRRITVTGFGGQGKTVLAAEAGRWLVRSGMFAGACFIDFSKYQGVDPVGYGVSALAVTLAQNLMDAVAAEKVLSETPTLIIMDNLESLMDVGNEIQTALLDAATGWSKAGGSRVLITTRQHRLGHPDYAEAGQREHQYLDLSGLTEHDAVHYFTALWELPPDPDPHIQMPERHGLVELFSRVGFHPLSVSLLAYQLKKTKVADLGERLEKLLADAPGKGPQKSLRASLDLSLERLSPEALQWLPGLGVFQGGAMEDALLQVTALGKVDEDTNITDGRGLLEALKSKDPVAIARAMGADLPEGYEMSDEITEKLFAIAEEAIAKLEAQLAEHQPNDLAVGADEATWPEFRRALEIAGLIRAEPLPGVTAPYLKFHPALAPALWERVTEEEKARLSTRYRAVYYRISVQLYHQDIKEPHAVRAIVRCELPNLLFSVRAALTAGDEDAVDFVDNVNKFLNNFGLLRDRDDLNQRAEKAAGPGTKSWVLSQSNKGEALFAAGRYAEAEGMFRNILTTMGETPTYEQQSTIARLGRCLQMSGRANEAVIEFRKGIAMAENLEQIDGVRRQTGVLQTDLANTLIIMGDYAGARVVYGASIEIAQKLGDSRMVAVVNGQLGTLAMAEGNLPEAERRYKEALEIFRSLNEPSHEAVAQNQLGILYRKAKQWEAAENAYRESARLKESQGNLVGAAETYSNLAVTMTNAGRPAEAETWYRRAIALFEKGRNLEHAHRAISNLANLIKSDPNRLTEARDLAEQALAIEQTLDPGAAEIWTTYTILAEIADQQGRNDEASEYRRLSREARENFMGTQHQVGRMLTQFKPVIQAAAAACDGNPDARKLVEGLFDRFREAGYQIEAQIRAIWDGERDEETLVDDLDYDDTTIIRAILATLRGEDVFPAETASASEEKASADNAPSQEQQQQQQQLALAAALPAIHPEARTQAEPLLAQLTTAGFTALPQAIKHLWEGERNPDVLCQELDQTGTAIIHLALHLIENPEKLAQMMGE